MNIKWLYPVIAFFICLSSKAYSRQEIKNTDRLKVFIDCSNTWCDMTFLRSEITLVDFLLDNQAADVHVLITQQNTGSGGNRYQLIFFGQNRFRNQLDTIHFNTDANATEFEARDVLIKYIKLGLIPFLAKTAAVNDIAINLKKTGTGEEKREEGKTSTKDPWNYWVLRIGTNGNANADKVYKSLRYSGNLSANRTTEELKVSFSAYGSKNKSTFDYETGSGTEKFIVNNHDFGFSHYLVKSINTHWSWGYEANYNQSTFSNNKGSIYIRTAVEYNIFPYRDVNNKLFTFSYGFDARFNRYYDTTIYEKLKETLWGHGAEANISFKQKWGSSNVGIEYHNYFHNWKYLNLGVSGGVNVRITGGLSFNIYAFAGLTRDQLNLPKSGATEQEVLTRRRQLASSYNYYTSFGIHYRFGSKLNNFVNPRFEGGSGGMIFY